jgi:hypothetical protein
MGQFFPVVLQFGLSVANAVVHITAIRIDIRIFVDVFIVPTLAAIPSQRN